MLCSVHNYVSVLDLGESKGALPNIFGRHVNYVVFSSSDVYLSICDF